MWARGAGQSSILTTADPSLQATTALQASFQRANPQSACGLPVRPHLPSISFPNPNPSPIATTPPIHPTIPHLRLRGVVAARVVARQPARAEEALRPRQRLPSGGLAWVGRGVTNRGVFRLVQAKALSAPLCIGVEDVGISILVSGLQVPRIWSPARARPHLA